MNRFTEGIFPGQLEPDITLAGCIDIFENVWPNPDLLIEAVEYESSMPDSDLRWGRAGTFGDGPYQSKRTNYEICITQAADLYGNKLAKDIHNQMYFMLLAATLPYYQKHNLSQNMHHEYYNLLRYQGGQEYLAHYDGGGESRRVVSAILYLNDNYEGGEIEFPNFDIKIKPQAGMLILFPSNYAYTHIAHPVTEGTKYAIVTWLYEG